MRKTLSKKKRTKIKSSSYKGFILYEGASVLDGQDIVAIVTMNTRNTKTGDMPQVWILVKDVDPLSASKQGLDVSVCGNCPHRHFNKGACYVTLFQAPRSIWQSYKRGLYPKYEESKHSTHFLGRKLRLGAYGDPAAVPFEILEHIASLGSGHTGYTHQANHKKFDDRYIGLCQVSVDSPKQALKYQAMGASTFRVAMEDDSLMENEIECLSDSKGINCADCMLCDGKQSNIAIAVHGNLAQRFKTSLVPTVQL